jgi:flagellar hook-length control protein FliK
VTTDVISSAPQQSASPAGGLPGGDTARGPAGVADTFAALVAQLSGSDPSQPTAPMVPETLSNDLPAADVVAGALQPTPGKPAAGRKSGTGTIGGDTENPQPVTDFASDSTAAVVVAPWVWTLPEIRQQIPEELALSAKSGQAAGNDVRDHGAADDSQRPASIPVTAVTVSVAKGAAIVLNLSAGAAGDAPADPIAPPSGAVGTVPEQSASANVIATPTAVLKPVTGTGQQPAAVPSTATAAAEAYRQASLPRPADGVARSRELPAANGTAASSQVTPVTSREGGSAFVPPSTGTSESSDRKSDHAFADQGGQNRQPLPASGSVDTALAGVAHNDLGAAVMSGQIAAAMVATSQSGTPSVVQVQPAVIAQPISVPDDAGLSQQIVQAVRLQWHDGVGDARLTLKPDYLGEVTISLRVEQGAVTAHLNADSSEVRAWMSANEPLLRQGLSEHGLTLDRLVVSDESAEHRAEDDSRRAPLPQREEEKPQPRPKRDTSTFEIIV